MFLQLNTIILFFLITLGLGYSVLWLSRARQQEHALLAFLEMLAIGLAAFSFLGIVLNLLHIPLNIWIYASLAIACPVIEVVLFFARKGAKQRSELSLQRFWTSQATLCALALLAVLAILFAVLHTGAFSYPYLEDDDPWNHAVSAMYVATQHTYSIDPQVRELSSGYAYYLEPYPPAFGVIMGVLRQANDSIVWTLKFFNVLLATLAVAFFYLFAREFTKSDMKALFAAFILAALPGFMSHFIWSQTLALALYPVALYAALRASADKGWIIPAIVAVASMMVTQPVVSFFFALTLVLIALFVFAHESLRKGAWKKRFEKTLRLALVGAAGAAASLLYWGAQLAKWGWEGFLRLRGGDLPGSGSGWSGGYALQQYTLGEVLFPAHSSRIDQAVGWGLAVTLALALGIVMIVLARKRTLALRTEWRYWPLLIWFALLFVAVFGPSLGVPGYGSSRLWPELAMPLALIAVEGVFILAASVAGKSQLARLGLVVLVAIGIAATSIPAKIAVQTAQWPAGGQWQAPQVEIPAYVQMSQTIPKGSRVYAFCSGDQRALGFDMMSEPWDYETALFRKQAINLSSEEIVAFLERHDYDYVTVDATCVVEFGENETARLAEKLTQAQRFQPLLSEPGFILARFAR